MDQLHTSTVTQDQIDHLGHMNVHYYAVLARVGAGKLVDRVAAGDGRGPRTWVRDVYVRHHREQLLGASLAVRGGVLDASPTRIRAYEELANLDTGEVAATFVLGIDPIDGQRRPASFPSMLLERARSQTVEVPDHGRSRSISFDDDPEQTAPLLEELVERGLAQRESRIVQDDECDEDGWFLSEQMLPLVWGGVPLDGHEFQPFHETEDGTTLGWATMETRSTWSRLPRTGDRVQSFGAEVDLGAKTMTSRHWVYDLERAELVCALSIVNLAFDVTARRSLEIPEVLRESFLRRIQTDLA
jgi:acyl-CoA thioesterase FadM